MPAPFLAKRDTRGLPARLGRPTVGRSTAGRFTVPRSTGPPGVIWGLTAQILRSSILRGEILMKAFLVSLSMLVLCGCALDAERDNPLDPLSPHYTAIAGRVMDRAHFPIPGTRITVMPEDVSTLTDSSGQYAIPGLKKGTHLAHAEVPSYASDSQQVQVAVGQVALADFELNAQPYFQSVKAVSAHEPVWPLDIHFAYLTATPDDGDGSPDVESVHVVIEDIDYERSMLFDHDLGCFTHTIMADSLPGRSLHNLIGKEIGFTVTDRQGGSGQATTRLVRIIDPLPIIVSPKNGEKVGPRPILEWDFYVPYEVTYSIRLYRTQPHSLVWSVDSILQSTSSTQVPDSLDQGAHYWTLTAFDAFGNWSKSEEASFQVEN